MSQSESESEPELEQVLESEVESKVEAEVELEELELEDAAVDGAYQPSGYLVQLVQRHTQDTTNNP